MNSGSIADRETSVFLSYASEEFDQVSQLYKRLQSVGIKPWIKRTSLAGRLGEEYLASADATRHRQTAERETEQLSSSNRSSRPLLPAVDGCVRTRIFESRKK